MVLHVLVTTDTPKIYTLWIPPGQAFSSGSLLFDWKPAAAILAASIPGDPYPGAFEGIYLANEIFAGGRDVVATNLLITAGVLLMLLAGGTLCNKALEENVRGWGVSVVVLPGLVGGAIGSAKASWATVARGWAAIIPGRTWVDRAAAPAGLLIITGFIYSLLEPGFGWNEESLALFVSMVVSQGVLVAFYEGGKAMMYRRSLRVNAGLRLFPACMLIALVSVAISRVAGFQPGFVVGFVASATILGKPDFTDDERGRAWTIMAAGMLFVSVASWLLALPLAELYDWRPNFWTSLPEAIAVAIFVVCLQGLLFNLIPLEFMDGWRIWKYNPWAWFALFIPSAFLFTQILFNQHDAYLDLIARTRSITGMLILFGYLGATFGTWAFFRWRSERPRQQSGAPAQGGD